MSETRIKQLASEGDGLLIIEGAMGLFDGAPPYGRGATADLARILGLPVVLVVDAARMSQSVAPLVAGFAAHDPKVHIAGVILNRVGSERHAAMLRAALAPVGVPVLGAMRRDSALALPDRHLGLVQAQEHPALDAFLDRAADAVDDCVDLDALCALASDLPAPVPSGSGWRAPLANSELNPPAHSIAIAYDQAFAFAYPHLWNSWSRGGARLTFFSPLADDPVPEAEFIFLPGGYPELHAESLAANATFLHSLRAASHSAQIYGECGGYMVLGETLTDAEGRVHHMAGLLDLRTSFAERRLHLGYRRLTAGTGPLKGKWNGHEFHYATTLRAEGTPLFEAEDAEGTRLPPMGLIKGNVSGSFAHIIDAA